MLSERRAEAVYDILINQNVSSEQMSSKGYGETRPVATNKTIEGKAKNRRVEIAIIEH